VFAAYSYFFAWQTAQRVPESRGSFQSVSQSVRSALVGKGVSFRFRGGRFVREDVLVTVTLPDRCTARGATTRGARKSSDTRRRGEAAKWPMAGRFGSAIG
jgi:hypothetical protein